MNDKIKTDVVHGDFNSMIGNNTNKADIKTIPGVITNMNTYTSGSNSSLAYTKKPKVEEMNFTEMPNKTTYTASNDGYTKIYKGEDIATASNSSGETNFLFASASNMGIDNIDKNLSDEETGVGPDERTSSEDYLSALQNEFKTDEELYNESDFIDDDTLTASTSGASGGATSGNSDTSNQTVTDTSMKDNTTTDTKTSNSEQVTDNNVSQDNTSQNTTEEQTQEFTEPNIDFGDINTSVSDVNFTASADIPSNAGVEVPTGDTMTASVDTPVESATVASNDIPVDIPTDNMTASVDVPSDPTMVSSDIPLSDTTASVSIDSPSDVGVSTAAFTNSDIPTDSVVNMPEPEVNLFSDVTPNVSNIDVSIPEGEINIVE